MKNKKLIMYFLNFDLKNFKKGKFGIVIRSDYEFKVFQYKILKDLPTKKLKITIDDLNNRYLHYDKINKSNVVYYILSFKIPPLKFLGRGSAFNTKEGNTSAYLKFNNNKTMLLIDCGETAFSKLRELNVLDGVKKLYIILTHLHPDHCDSLGSLIFYMNYIKNIKPNILVHDDIYCENIKSLLKLNGVGEELYETYLGDESASANFGFGYARTGIRSFSFDNIEILSKMHNWHCLGVDSFYFNIINKITNNTIIYSGDTSMVPCIYDYSKCEQLYIEACNDKESKIHLYIKKIKVGIHNSDKVTIMHIDSDETIEIAKSLGFNVAEVEQKGK